MLKHFLTTTLIISWCVIWSALWAYASFEWVCRAANYRRHGGVVPTDAVIFPTLGLAPLVIVLGWSLFGINLIYPVAIVEGSWPLVSAAAIPALVLFVVSGLWRSVTRGIVEHHDRWRGSPFVLLARTVGRGERAALRRLVLMSTLTEAWGACLPWLFGELLAIEVIFNAPGLALDAWHLARVRDLGGLGQSLAWLLAIYSGCCITSARIHQWLGRKLESF